MNITNFFSLLAKYIVQQSRGMSILSVILSSMIGMLIVHLIFFIRARILEEKIPWKEEILWFMLVWYFCFGCQITLFRRNIGRGGGISSSMYIGSLTGNYLQVQQFFYVFLNILFFIPWGFLVGLLFDEDSFLHRTFSVVCYSFLTSFAIEVTQFLTTRGQFELLDILTNVSGGFLGGIFSTFGIVAIRKITVLFQRHITSE